MIKKQIDLVFFDPPYAVSPHEVMAIAKGYFEKGILKEDALPHAMNLLKLPNLNLFKRLMR